MVGLRGLVVYRHPRNSYLERPMIRFRKGDIVSIHGTISHTIDDGEERVFVKLPDSHSDLWIKHQHVTLVATVFEVNDRVTWDGDAENNGVILAISDGHAWIDM